MVKGLDILLKNLSEQECPSWRELRDLGRENDAEQICIYGDGKHQDKCMECWKKAAQENYSLLEREEGEK